MVEDNGLDMNLKVWSPVMLALKYPFMWNICRRPKLKWGMSKSYKVLVESRVTVLAPDLMAAMLVSMLLLVIL